MVLKRSIAIRACPPEVAEFPLDARGNDFISIRFEHAYANCWFQSTSTIFLSNCTRDLWILGIEVQKKRKKKRSRKLVSIDRTFVSTPALYYNEKKEKRRKIPFSEISRTVQVAVSQDDATPATCPTSVLAGTTALGCSRLSFNEFFPSHPPSLPPISHPSISLADVIKRNVTRKFSGALRPGSDHCTYPRFIAVCTTHFARPPSIAARSRSTGYSRRSCHSIVSNLRS